MLKSVNESSLYHIVRFVVSFYTSQNDDDMNNGVRLPAACVKEVLIWLLVDILIYHIRYIQLLYKSNIINSSHIIS